MWTFRATYDVRELGILRGDWIRVDEELVIHVGRRLPPSRLRAFIPHLGLYDHVEGLSLQVLLERWSQGEGARRRPDLRVVR